MKPPRVADLLLHLLVPREELTALLGDLEETFGTKSGRGAALWYWRETILTIFHANARAIQKRPTLVLGTLGFAVLVAIVSRLSMPWLGVFSIPALLFAIAIILRVMNVAAFSRRFAWTQTAFMVPVWILYAMTLNAAIPLRVLMMSLGFAVALGAVSSSIVAAFSSERSSRFLLFPSFPVFAYAFLQAIRPVSQSGLDAFSVFLPGFLLLRQYRILGLWSALVDLFLWSAIGWALMNRLHSPRCDKGERPSRPQSAGVSPGD